MRRSLLVAFLALAALVACGAEPAGRGTIHTDAVDPAIVAARTAADAQAGRVIAERGGTAAPDKQILFGDLHVHTTFSPDAFAMSLPIQGGEGARPPAMACDFARHCSALDFWSINDHAEGVTPRRWNETIESIRECNASAGDPANPDLVSFLGWEWSQVAWSPDEHYGHKNVIFRETDDVPARAIGAPRERLAKSPLGAPMRALLALQDPASFSYYWNYGDYYEETAAVPRCEAGVDTRELPADCMETAADPQTLFEKLGQWGYESIVIPHGNAWGLNTPPGTSFDKQLTPAMHDAERQTLIEVYSGHGNSEEYRDWRHVETVEDGSRICPAPTDDFLPCCWRAGELIEERCLEAGESAEECAGRAEIARANHVEASVSGHWTVPGASVEDWLDCGTCRDCFNPPMDLRPGTTTQYALALSRQDEAGRPLRFRFGFIGSSDVHRARPGTGYKEFDRKHNTEVVGSASERAASMLRDGRDPEPHSVRYVHGVTDIGLQHSRPMERQASFFMTGGLVAVHSAGRDRGAIWSALERKEVYATSGDRILLWFDLLDGGATVPMGSELRYSRAPRFRVRAVGAFEQKPGCPDHTVSALGPERIADVCLGECYHPSGARRRITRIEVVRIRPQSTPAEDVGDLIEDPWRTFACDGDPAGCAVEFDDPEFVSAGRDAVYYVRAIQEPTPAVNAGNLRCERDETGACVALEPCFGGWPTSPEDDCLAPNEERAWSSPIFVDFERAPGGGAEEPEALLAGSVSAASRASRAAAR